MSFTEQTYRELEAVVGRRNISRDVYILAGNRAKTPEIPLPTKARKPSYCPAARRKSRKSCASANATN